MEGINILIAIYAILAVVTTGIIMGVVAYCNNKEKDETKHKSLLLNGLLGVVFPVFWTMCLTYFIIERLGGLNYD